MIGLLCAMFLLSGAAALLFETLWFHQARIAFGNSVWASSLVLAGFMGGLALGNGLVARLGHRVARPVRLYAALEVAIAASGVALVHVLPELAGILGPALRGLEDQPWLLQPLRLGTAFALLLVPSTAMGATLPLLVAALYRRRPEFGRVLGLLYGWNTLGAVGGALLGEAWLVEALGIRGSALVAAGGNAGALALALGLAPRLDAPAPPAGAPRGRGAVRAPLPARGTALLVAAGLFGGVLMALEVVWFRLLVLKIHASALAFSILLAVVLAGIGLGGLAASAWLRRRPGAARTLPVLALASAALCLLTYSAHGLVLQTHPGPVHRWADVARLGIPLMLPVAALSGVLFTLLGDALHREALPGQETRAAGLLTLANTTGAMLGPLLGGFVLLPGLGVERSVLVLAGVYAAAGLGLAGLVPGPGTGGLRRRSVLAALAVTLGAFVFFPHGALREHYLADTLARFVRAGATPLAVREGLTETAVYLRDERFGEPVSLRLVTNSHSMSTTNLPSRRYMNLFAWLPAALHPDLRSALLISYGVGNTLQALVDLDTLERIDVVDISRDVLELSREVHPGPGPHPLDDPRVHVHVEDGRWFLQASARRWDLVTGEPPPPKMAGVVTLYTREYFELMRARLAEGGIATYWLPVHTLLEDDAKAIVAAFCDAFPDCSLWSGAGLDWLLMGTRDARGPVSAGHFRSLWSDPAIGPQLRDLGLERPELLGTLFMLGPDGLEARTRDVPPLTDDRPKRLADRVLGARRLLPTWLPWLDVDEARRRFAASELVARLWPPELREQTLARFDTRTTAHRRLLAALADPDERLERFHRLVDGDPPATLPTLALWELGSDADQQRAAAAARARGLDTPALHLELGMGALARGAWEAAARHLARASAGDDPRAEAYAAYAWCRAGRPTRARAAAAAAPGVAPVLRALDPACTP